MLKLVEYITYTIMAFNNSYVQKKDEVLQKKYRNSKWKKNMGLLNEVENAILIFFTNKVTKKRYIKKSIKIIFLQ